MTVLPCNKPPGVMLVVKLAILETPLVDQVFVESENISLLERALLKVTLDQLKNSIGFEVCVITYM